MSCISLDRRAAHQLVEVVVVPRLLQYPRILFPALLLSVEVQGAGRDGSARAGTLAHHAVDVLDEFDERPGFSREAAAA
jgi:hypothetical protein